MPRVLIADDNSNVQRMVALALKDAGIEVVAVGNGDAAVRKMTEVRPDLVLADIFMPVRNGYEVCEFVKHDPRYMNIPVVLLVGAFDPLDEREVQRVQADGVLKKPFVPPDPLISMVTSLLAKCGCTEENLVGVAVPAAASSVAAEAAKVSKPAPTMVVQEYRDSPPEGFAPPVSGIKLEDGIKPLAFGSLLESPVISTDQTDPIVTATRDPKLGEPAFWTQPAVEEPTADELTEGHKWDDPLPHHSDLGLSQSADAADLAGAEEHEVSEEIGDFAVEFTESETAHDTVEGTAAEAPVISAESTLVEWSESTAAAESDLAAEEPLVETVASDVASAETAAVPEQSAPAEPEVVAEPVQISAAEESAVVEQTAAVFEPIAADEPPPATAAPTAVAPAAQIASEKRPDLKSASAIELLAIHEDFPAVVEAWKPAARPNFPWSRQDAAEVKPVEPPVVSKQPEPEVHLAATPEPEPASVTPIEAVEPEHAQDTAPAVEHLVEQAATHAPLSPEDLEAVVTRVMDRMQPKMVEIVTQEILRPVVEALVRRELEKS